MISIPTDPPRPEFEVGAMDMRQIAALLVRAAQLHEGIYWAAINFNASGMNFQLQPQGPVLPSVVIQIAGISLNRQILNGPKAPEGLSVDAAVVNPKARNDG
jgi:hypothetical protein